MRDGEWPARKCNSVNTTKDRQLRGAHEGFCQSKNSALTYQIPSTTIHVIQLNRLHIMTKGNDWGLIIGHGYILNRDRSHVAKKKVDVEVSTGVTTVMWLTIPYKRNI